MYYEEKYIDGILFCRNSPRGSWTPVYTEEERALQESKQVIMDLVRGFTHGQQGKENPYCKPEVKRALKYLAKQQGISDYLDAIVESDLYPEGE